jgi:hypothetical protein
MLKKALYTAAADLLTRWATMAGRNGGPPSGARLSAVARFIAIEMNIGTWPLFDDYWFWWGENQKQAVVSVKQGLIAVPFNGPTFNANQGFTGDGLSAYVATGFIPSVHGRAMSGGRARMEVYVRGNLSANADAIGVTSGTTMRLRPRLTTNKVSAGIMCAFGDCPDSITDSRGMSGAERNGDTTLSFDKTGISLSPTTITPATTLPTREFYLLASNNGGSATSFYSGQIGYSAVGAPLLNAAQRLAHYNNVQQLATDIGANV